MVKLSLTELTPVQPSVPIPVTDLPKGIVPGAYAVVGEDVGRFALVLIAEVLVTTDGSDIGNTLGWLVLILEEGPTSEIENPIVETLGASVTSLSSM